MCDKVMSEHQDMDKMPSKHLRVVKDRKYLAGANCTRHPYNMECKLLVMCCANQSKTEASSDTTTVTSGRGSDENQLVLLTA